jgi:hypothetical protein
MGAGWRLPPAALHPGGRAMGGSGALPRKPCWGGPVGPCVRNKGNGRGMGGRAGGDRRRGGVVVKKKLTSGPHV